MDSLQGIQFIPYLLKLIWLQLSWNSWTTWMRPLSLLLRLQERSFLIFLFNTQRVLYTACAIHLSHHFSHHHHLQIQKVGIGTVQLSSYHRQSLFLVIPFHHWLLTNQDFHHPSTLKRMAGTMSGMFMYWIQKTGKDSMGLLVAILRPMGRCTH